MQTNWYPNDGAGSGTGNVYDGGGGGYYGCENVSFYGPPAMRTMDYTDKLKPTGFDPTSCYPGGIAVAGSTRGNFPGGFDGAVSGTSTCPGMPYQNATQGLGPQQHQAPVGMLYNQSQMMAPTVMGSNNDYHQQQHHQPPHVSSSNHHLVGGAYQPFCQALPPPPPPPHQQSSYGAELSGKSSEVVSQSLVPTSGTTSFLEQPYVAANYAPCQGPPPWNYAYCYGYYGQEPCPFVNMVDMEDFM
uniref:Uncharacterized protein n=1 Tax=Anopheles maculatus TaxID=74869 RepID=A0A182SZL1_9DIPT